MSAPPSRIRGNHLHEDDNSWDMYQEQRHKRAGYSLKDPASATSFLTAVPNAAVQGARWLLGTTVDKVSSDAKWVATEVSQLRSQGWDH